MMQLTIEGKSIELTDAMREYVEEKVQMLEKYADIVKTDVDLGKTTSHHEKGEIYFCEMHVFIPGKDFFIKKEEEDLYKAIDKVKDHLKNELTTWKDRKMTERKETEAEGVEEEN